MIAMKNIFIGAPARLLHRLAPVEAVKMSGTGLKARMWTILALAFVSTVVAEANGIVFRVHLANGADQYYRIDVPNVPPLTLNPRTWTTPSMATNRFSAKAAGVTAVAWAGGLSKTEKVGPPNSLVNAGGATPGGFYNASNVRIDSVQRKNKPVSYYLVQMTGQIGSTRQKLYAAVLEDGRIVRPTPVGGSPRSMPLKVKRTSRH